MDITLFNHRDEKVNIHEVPANDVFAAIYMVISGDEVLILYDKEMQVLAEVDSDYEEVRSMDMLDYIALLNGSALSYFFSIVDDVYDSYERATKLKEFFNPTAEA